MVNNKSTGTAVFGLEPTRRPLVAFPSKVRLLGARNVGVAVVVIILMAVFSTDDFRQNIRSRHIGQGRGPRRREDALVLDREVQLKELAPVLAVDIAGRQPILFYVPLDCVFHVIVFAE